VIYGVFYIIVNDNYVLIFSFYLTLNVQDMKKMLSLLITLTSFYYSSAQNDVAKPKMKFGDVTAADFAPTVYSIDSSASAVILFDAGYSRFEGNKNGWFNISFKHHKRMRIMNKNGFDAATVQIYLYKGKDDEEKLEDLDAVTYNLENGKVVSTKVDKASIFKEKVSSNNNVRKFTFPNLKEGTIVEFKYTINSPYIFNFQPWTFQWQYPCLWSQYETSVPSMFSYVALSTGYHPFVEKKEDYGTENFYLTFPGQTATDRTESQSISMGTLKRSWAMQNVPPLKTEPFTTSIRNHLSRIEFQLKSITYESGRVDDIMGSWQKATADLLGDDRFGAALNKANNYFDSDVKKALEGATDNYDKAQRIYTFVRDNFTCTDYDAVYMSNDLKKIFQTKNGNVADINLLLTAIYRSQGFEAQPVILSTKDNGKVFQLYPLISKYNYVISRVKVDDAYFLVDAAYNKLGIGRLHEDAYNGTASIIETGTPVIDLSPDSLIEAKVTFVNIANSADGKKMEGSFQSDLTYYESYNLRQEMTKQTEEEYFNAVKKSYGFDVTISNGALDSLKAYDQPTTVRYNFSFSPDEDIIYLSPMLTEAQRQNPFKAANRFYPVEMPYAFDETYVLEMEVPKGYAIDEAPKSTRVKFNDDEGMFEYLISAKGNNIQLRSRTMLKKATFAAEDYTSLRDFFAMIVKKHSEQIVLKKIK
jgi:transglutaminase-like putative cysteine protease